MAVGVKGVISCGTPRYEVIEYIHNDPVRRGLVTTATDWPWSSARDWAGLGDPYITVDRTLPPLHPVARDRKVHEIER